MTTLTPSSITPRRTRAPAYSRLFPFCCWQGKLDEALELFMKSLAIKQQVYGDDHPKVATAMNGIAQVYQKQVL